MSEASERDSQSRQEDEAEKRVRWEISERWVNFKEVRVLVLRYEDTMLYNATPRVANESRDSQWWILHIDVT
jgi:hypothetical protein